MKNGKKMIQELEARKNVLVQQLKELQQNEASLTPEEQKQKTKMERELVEIMDRLTQLSFLLKS
ncbi:MAG: hypothetical protein ACTSRS_10375 [Candidatus Helarchaeota archaeon]